MSYEVGENIICQTGSSWDSWQPAVVTAIRNTTYQQSGYHCRLNLDGRSVFKYVYNEDDNIRRHDFNLDNHLEVLLHHLSWGASPDLLQRIIDAHSMDIRLVGPKMLFACVRYNVTETLQWLVDVQGVSLGSCDESGRNCLLLAVHHKQVDMISLLMNSHLTVCLSRLFKGVDHRKWNLLHYLVLANDEAAMSWLVDSEIEPTRSLYEVREYSYREERMAEGGTVKGVAEVMHLTEWCDEKGRTARDMAVSLKRLNLVTILDNFHIQAKLFHALQPLELSLCSGKGETELTNLIASVAELRVDLRTQPLSAHNSRYLSQITFHLVSKGVFEHGVLWMYNNWRHDLPHLMMQHEPLLAGTERDILVQLLKGPDALRLTETNLRFCLGDPDGYSNITSIFADITPLFKIGVYLCC